ncbi:MAG: 3-hydroxyacyl-CoA dehydrogenase, partial [Proteobacteria bacterium]|nr:3-hydroxyacyl-CoA dehydrogenase [Pseudomonadota bacterium]
NQAPKRQASAITLTLNESDRELISKARSNLAKKTRGESAPQRIIDCIEASAELDFDAGLKRERELFMASMEDPQSAALRHMFFAERAAAKIDSIDTSVRRRSNESVLSAPVPWAVVSLCASPKQVFRSR